MAITFDANVVRGTSKSAATSFGLAMPVAVANKIAFAFLAKDNTSTTDGNNNEVTSVTDNKGNTWEKQVEFTNGQGAAGAGVTVSIWKSKLTTTVGAGDTLTFNFASCTAKAAVIGSFSVAAGNDLQIAGTPQTIATDGAAIPNTSLSGLPNKEYLFIRVTGVEAPISGTGSGANYTFFDSIGTTGGSTATNVAIIALFRIFTGTGSTNNATTSPTNADNATIFVAFEEYTPGGAPVDLTSQNITTTAPTINQTSIGQSHALTSATLATAAAILSATSIGQIHALNSVDLAASTPIVGSSSITQTHILNSNNIATGTAVLTPSTANIIVIYNFASQGISLPSAIVGITSLGQVHGLTSASLTTTAPFINTTNLGQIHNINSQFVVTSAPLLSGSTLAQVNAVISLNLATTQPTINITIVTQIHKLISGGLGNEIVANGDFGNGITGWSDYGGSPTIQAGQLKVSSGVAAYAEVGQTLLGPFPAGSYRLTGTMTPSYQDYAMISLGTYVLDDFIFALYSETGSNFTIDFTIPVETSQFDIYLDAANDHNWTKAPNGEYALFDNISIKPLGFISTSAAVISSSSIGQVYALTAINLVTNAAVLSVSSIGIITAIVSVNLSTFAPIVNLTSLTQVHTLGSTGLVTTAPNVSIASVGQAHTLASLGLITAAPALSTASMGQTHVLGALSLVSGAPSLSVAGISQTHVLTSVGIETFAPLISVTGIGQEGSLFSLNLSTPIPVISTTAIGQTHSIASQGIVTSIPVIQISGMNAIYNINSISLVTTQPELSSSNLAQNHTLTSIGLTTQLPEINSSLLGTVYVLYSNSIATASPEISLAFVVALDETIIISQDIVTNVPYISQSLIIQYPDTPIDRILTIEYEERMIIVAPSINLATLDNEARLLVVSFENRTIVR